MNSQTELSKAIEKEEENIINNRLQDLAKKARINPNTIWETRKRAKGFNGLDYKTITEEGKHLTDPQETKDYIANYFEELYQAREGTPEYSKWTKITTETVRQALKPQRCEADNNEINIKEFNSVIKKTEKEQKPRTRQDTKWNIHWRNPGN